GDARSDVLWSILADRWCRWGSCLLGREDSVTVDWLVRRMRKLPTVIALDGLDEFFTNNRGFGIFEMRELLRYLGHEFSGNRRRSLVIGVPPSQHGIHSLATDRNHIFEILRPTVAQAIEHFPGSARLLEQVKDESVRRTLLTPLILTRIGARAGRLGDFSSLMPAEVIAHALLAIVEESHLAHILDGEGRHTEPEQWIMSLMLVGLVFYRDFLG